MERKKPPSPQTSKWTWPPTTRALTSVVLELLPPLGSLPVQVTPESELVTSPQLSATATKMLPGVPGAMATALDAGSVVQVSGRAALLQVAPVSWLTQMSPPPPAAV